MAPLFSIITATYNRPELLKRALNSIAGQTFGSYEVIVVDDASSPPVAIPSSLTLNNVQLFTRRKNGGPAAAYNSGLSVAKGDLIVVLDDDDEFHPSFLEKTAGVFENNPAIDFSWCSVRVVSSSASASASSAITRQFPARYDKREDLHLDALSIGNGFGFTVKACLYKKLGGYDESFNVTEDAEFLYRLLKAGATPHAIPETLVTVHNHDVNRMTDSRFDDDRATECERILSLHGDFIKSHPRIEAQLQRHIKLLRSKSNASEYENTPSQ